VPQSSLRTNITTFVDGRMPHATGGSSWLREAMRPLDLGNLRIGFVGAII